MTTLASFVRLIIPVVMQPIAPIIRTQVEPPEVGLRWGQPGSANKQREGQNDDGGTIIDVGDNQDEEFIREGVAVEAAVDHLGIVVEESNDDEFAINAHGPSNMFFIKTFIEEDERTEDDGSITPIERHVRLYVKIGPNLWRHMPASDHQLDKEFDHATHIGGT